MIDSADETNDEYESVRLMALDFAPHSTRHTISEICPINVASVRSETIETRSNRRDVRQPRRHVERYREDVVSFAGCRQEVCFRISFAKLWYSRTLYLHPLGIFCLSARSHSLVHSQNGKAACVSLAVILNDTFGRSTPMRRIYSEIDLLLDREHLFLMFCLVN